MEGLSWDPEVSSSSLHVDGNTRKYAESRNLAPVSRRARVIAVLLPPLSLFLVQFSAKSA